MISKLDSPMNRVAAGTSRGVDLWCFCPARPGPRRDKGTRRGVFGLRFVRVAARSLLGRLGEAWCEVLEIVGEKQQHRR